MTSNPRASSSLPGLALIPGYLILLAAMMTVGDYVCHVNNQVLEYANPGAYSLFPGQPTGQVFLNFFIFIAVASVSVGWFAFRKTPEPPRLIPVLTSSAVFFSLYYLSGYLKSSPMTVFSICMIVWAIQVHIFQSRLPGIIWYSVVIGIWGPMWEGWFSENGFFIYYDQDAYFVPVWLSALYFNGAIAIAAAVALLEKWRVGGIPLLESSTGPT